MGILTQYHTDIARFDGDSVYDMMLISHHIGRYDSYGSIYSTYADCLGYRFDEKGKIYYNYDMIAYCDDGRIVKWIGGDTIAYYEGDVRGAAAAAIICLLAPKIEDSYGTDDTSSAGSASSDESHTYTGGGGGGGGGGYFPGGGVPGGRNGQTRGRGCGTIPGVLFSAVSLILWYFVLTSSDAALGHDISLAVSAIILGTLLVSIFALRKKDFMDIYGFTFIASSVVCIIISVFFDNNGYPFFAALLVSLICVPLVIGGLSFIPSLIAYLLVKMAGKVSSKEKKNGSKD